MLGFSPEQGKYQRSNKCPKCGRFVIPPFASLHFRSADGSPISILTPFPLMDKSAIAQCPKCGGEWPVFASGHVPDLPIADDDIEIIETGRIEEPYYEDERVLDNRGGTTPATQTVSVSEQWTQTIQFEHERTITGTDGVGINVAQFISIEAKAENALRRNYSISESRQQTYTGQISTEVPARTRRHLVLSYRRIWQEGLVRVPTPSGNDVEIPFRIALNLTLDWSQRDEISAG